MSQNTLELVWAVIARLHTQGIDVLLGGGWAEELHGLIKAKHHGDIDLYYPVDNFNKLDDYIMRTELHEIEAKHKFHKRAFIYKGIMIEVILIQSDSEGYYSNYNNDKIIRWPKPLNTKVKGINCLSQKALSFKRSVHGYLFGHLA